MVDVSLQCSVSHPTELISFTLNWTKNRSPRVSALNETSSPTSAWIFGPRLAHEHPYEQVTNHYLLYTVDPDVKAAFVYGPDLGRRTVPGEKKVDL